MSSQVYPAVVAIMLGVGLAVVLFIPFVAVQYRRTGRLSLVQMMVWGSFLIYGLALWTYTLLPLPNSATIRCVGAQTTPFQFVDDILSYPIGSLGAIARNPAVMQVLLNIALFVPLGFFLRMVWRRGVVVTTIAGLAISFLIECTQYTGVWGIYSCGYRLFDVDDLIANTAGALAGGVLSLALKPTLARWDAAYEPPTARPVTFWRRMLGMLCDAVAYWLVGAVAGVAVNGFLFVLLGRDLGGESRLADIAFAAVPLVLFGLITLITGRTIGDAAIAIRWHGGARPEIVRNLLRYVGGVGGWQLVMAFAPGLDALFVLVVVIALIATPGRGGLPGLVSGARPVDSRGEPARTAEPSGPTA
ncbi:VanZ family protein [Microbacterium sp.]|uniref:VanZ family protein n=1 Tax=Microbacterium sp. TaxID=51671 RepID=UPI003F9E3F88